MARKSTPKNALRGPGSTSGQATGAAEDPSLAQSQAQSQAKSQAPLPAPSPAPALLPAAESAVSAGAPEGFDRRQNTVDRRQFERVVESPVPRREAD